MFSFLFSVLSFLLLLSHSVTAAPVKPVELLAVAPKVTSPAAGARWNADSYQTVAWDISKVPTEAQGYFVEILLGYLVDGSENENLDTAHPLISHVPIMDGTASVYVPGYISTGNNYIVVVNGDSGNHSELFTIEASEESLIL